MHLRDLLECRTGLLPSLPAAAIWLLPTSRILETLECFGWDGLSSGPIPQVDLVIPAVDESASSVPNLNPPTDGEFETQSVSDIDEIQGPARYEYVDSDDEEETALLAQHIEVEPPAGDLFEPDTRAFPVAELPRDDGEDPILMTNDSTFRWLWRERTRTDARLPPIAILFEAIDGMQEGAPSSEPPRFEAWSIIRQAAAALSTASPCPRLAMDSEGRSFECVNIPAAALKTLDARRILDWSIISVYSQLLLQDHNSGSSVGGAYRPKVWIAPPGAQHLSPDLLVNLFCKVCNLYYVPQCLMPLFQRGTMYDRDVGVKNCDYWLIPLYAARRKHWILGVIELSQDVRTKPVVFKYIDSHPLHAWSMSAQGSEWAFAASTHPCKSYL